MASEYRQLNWWVDHNINISTPNSKVYLKTDQSSSVDIIRFSGKQHQSGICDFCCFSVYHTFFWSAMFIRLVYISVAWPWEAGQRAGSTTQVLIMYTKGFSQTTGSLLQHFSYIRRCIGVGQMDAYVWDTVLKHTTTLFCCPNTTF